MEARHGQQGRINRDEKMVKSVVCLVETDELYVHVWAGTVYPGLPKENPSLQPMRVERQRVIGSRHDDPGNESKLRNYLIIAFSLGQYTVGHKGHKCLKVARHGKRR